MPDKKVLQQVINVKKSNNLIQSLGKTTLLSNKVFLTSLLKIEERTGVPEAEKEYYRKLEKASGTDFSTGLVAEFRNSDLRNIMGSKSGSYYTNIAELMDPTNSKSLRNQWVIMVKNPEDGLYGSTDVITSTLYDDKNGKLYIKFSNEPKIKKELHELKNNYTLLNYNLMMQFRSIYSYRIYELLMSRIGREDGITKEKKDEYMFTYGLSELKYLLGILDPYINKDVRAALSEPYPDFEKIEEMISGENVMPRYNDFKKYTLVKAKKEIDELTEFIFDYTPVRNGRGGKVVSVDLIMRRKNKANNQTEKKTLTEEEKDQLLDEIADLIEYPLKIKDLRSIAEAAEYNKDKIVKAYEVLQSSPAEKSNVVGYLIKAIREDYTVIKGKPENKNAFNQFPQRKYDFEKLEKEILGEN